MGCPFNRNAADVPQTQAIPCLALVTGAIPFFDGLCLLHKTMYCHLHIHLVVTDNVPKSQ